MTAQFLAKWLTIHKSILVCSAVDSGGAGDARSPLEFGGSANVIIYPVRMEILYL